MKKGFFRIFLKKRVWIPLVVVLLLIFPLYLLQNVLLDNFHPVIPNQVYRSAQPDIAYLTYDIKKYHIKSVINLRGENKDKSWYDSEVIISKLLHVKHYDLSLSAYKLPTPTQLRKLVHILQTAPRPMLIHCAGGSDRTGLAAAISIILSKNQSIDDLEDQISWQYDAISSSSIGYQVFENYYAWLKSNHKKHTKANFLQWVNGPLTLKPYSGRFYT